MLVAAPNPVDTRDAVLRSMRALLWGYAATG